MWALIEWTENDTSLDTVKKMDILQKAINGGIVIDLKYKDESSPAIILKLSDKQIIFQNVITLYTNECII